MVVESGSWAGGEKMPHLCDFPALDRPPTPAFLATLALVVEREIQMAGAQMTVPTFPNNGLSNKNQLKAAEQWKHMMHHTIDFKTKASQLPLLTSTIDPVPACWCP